MLTSARAVARGTVDCVLALPGVARRGEMLLHNHPSGRLEPSMADLSIAARLHDDGVGFGIVDNDGDRALRGGRGARGPRRVTPLDPFDVIALLGEHGPIARELGSYEDRPSQRDMAAHIADAYNDGGVLLLEAGTGVGKSFAYLVPALAWARANGERTVVSTNTINLQEQLVGKDLPLLARALGDDEYQPTFALLKGWRNYLCLCASSTATASQHSLLEGDKLDELVEPRRVGGRTRATARWPTCPVAAVERSLGRGGRRSRSLHAAAGARTSIAASSFRRAAGRPRPTSSWSTTTCSPPTSRCGRRRTTGRRPRCCRRTSG